MAGAEKPNLLYETMTLVRTAKYHIRVWRACDVFTMGPDKDVENVIRALSRHDTSAENLCAVLKGMKGIEAIEILDNENNGAVCYPNWR